MLRPMQQKITVQPAKPSQRCGGHLQHQQATHILPSVPNNRPWRWHNYTWTISASIHAQSGAFFRIPVLKNRFSVHDHHAATSIDLGFAPWVDVESAMVQCKNAELEPVLFPIAPQSTPLAIHLHFATMLDGRQRQDVDGFQLKSNPNRPFPNACRVNFEFLGPKIAGETHQSKWASNPHDRRLFQDLVMYEIHLEAQSIRFPELLDWMYAIHHVSEEYWRFLDGLRLEWMSTPI